MAKTNKFQEAVDKCDEIKGSLMPGLSAMGRNSVAVKATDPNKLNGSVDIDAAVKSIRPNEPRWDYAVGYSNQAFFIEVHPADTKNVDEMVKKVKWLKEWLSEVAPELKELHKSGVYHWIPSGRVKILKTSPQYKRIALNKLLIINPLSLK